MREQRNTNRKLDICRKERFKVHMSVEIERNFRTRKGTFKSCSKSASEEMFEEAQVVIREGLSLGMLH